ncbi:MAG: tyrosine-type recombinase/integrase [Planctomycetota bacterium]|nr:tyrosine-type recombinase/integrase [Planctomycetota bacterium]MDA1211918.1 tyrosine-type recombinase/integrase [Planctomycetota bacterium]
MARRPKPWYRKDRRAWFVTIDGTRHNLGPDKKAAHELFHQLMSQPQKRSVPSGSVVEIIDTFLEWCSNHRAPDTYEWYRFRLQAFAERYPDLRTAELKPFHVQEWLDAFNLSTGSKRNYCRAIKRCMRWAHQQGYVDHNPIIHMEQPESGTRDVLVSADEFEKMLALVPNRDFHELLTITWETGCRPQESLHVEARHADFKNSRWVIPPRETKGKALPRVVYLTDSALAITRRLVLKHPTGKLFRNSNGKAWTTDAVNCAFVRLQIRMGKESMRQRGIVVENEAIEAFSKQLASHRVVGGKTVQKTNAEIRQEAKRKLTNRLACKFGTKLSLYALRHSWATHALERGVDSLTVAVLMGHKDPSTLARVYQHLSKNPSYLLDEAKRAVG